MRSTQRYRLRAAAVAAAVTASLLVPLTALSAPSASAASAASTAGADQAADEAAVPAKDWLHAQGSTIVDDAGNKVLLTGANWFGFNATERVFHGLWSANIEDIAKSMSEHGINIVRVPISTQLILEWKNGQAAASSGVNTYANPELVGKTTLQVFDYWLTLCEKYGLKVMLDVHSAEADNSGHLYPVWWKGSVTVEQFYQGWEWITTRYRTNDTVVAMDIKNEPHGKWTDSPRAKWDGSADQDNFKNTCQTAGNRILAINPNVLILCEGIEIYPKNGTNWSSTNETDYYGNWWGGNLRGAKDHPVDLGANQRQLVYSPHDYGPAVYPQPWFQGTWDRSTLERDVWDPNWLYLKKTNTAPLLVGEWGGKLDGGANEKWMVAMRDEIVQYGLSHTFWCVNPNSGDTGGLLLDDWKTWDTAKYNLLKPALWQSGGKFVSLDHQVRLGGTGSSTGIGLADLYGGTTPTPDTQAPSVPGGLTSPAKTQTSVGLAWGASTDNVGVTGYEVYRGAVKVATVAGTSYTDTGLAAGTAYTYIVRARDAAGNVSAASSAVTVTTATGTTPDSQAPSVPGGLTSPAKTQTSVGLAWGASTDNVGVTGYEVYRGAVKVVTVAGTSYTDTGLAAGTAYTYTVRARDAAGNVSAASSAVTVTTTAGGGGSGTLLSQGRSAWASSSEDGATQPGNATDGNTGTRWASAFQDNQWINIDLGSSRQVTGVVLNWEAAYATTYKVQVSDDPNFGTWTDLYTTTAGHGGTESLTVSGHGRYVRLLGQQRATPYGVSLWEFQVYGS